MEILEPFQTGYGWTEPVATKLKPHQANALRYLARQRGVTVSQVVREALISYIRPQLHSWDAS